MSTSQDSRLVTRRKYMILKALMDDESTNIFLAREAVSEFALTNPDIDMEEERTWTEWEGIGRR